MATYGDDPGVSCHDWAALSLWFLGWPDRALDRAQKAVQLAETHLYSLATAQVRAAWIHQCRREVDPVQQWADRAIEVASQQGYPYQLALGTILKGWALALQGRIGDGLDLLRRGMADCHDAGAEMDRPYFDALLAEAYERDGQFEAGLSVLDEAVERVRSGRSYFYEPDLHRLQGTLYISRGNPGDRTRAERVFRRAHALAEDLQSPILQLRAATGLARLWQDTDRRDEGRALVKAAYHQFAEGFDTPDLVQARVFLDNHGVS